MLVVVISTQSKAMSLIHQCRIWYHLQGVVVSRSQLLELLLGPRQALVSFKWFMLLCTACVQNQSIFSHSHNISPSVFLSHINLNIIATGSPTRSPSESPTSAPTPEVCDVCVVWYYMEWRYDYDDDDIKHLSLTSPTLTLSCLSGHSLVNVIL